jgi:signal transduction histidine kinase
MSTPLDRHAPDGPENDHSKEDPTAIPPKAIPGEMEAFTAHEINQPLAAILGNAQAARRFILRDGISRDEILAILDDIIRDTKRAAEVVRRIR